MSTYSPRTQGLVTEMSTEAIFMLSVYPQLPVLILFTYFLTCLLSWVSVVGMYSVCILCFSRSVFYQYQKEDLSPLLVALPHVFLFPPTKPVNRIRLASCYLCWHPFLLNTVNERSSFGDDREERTDEGGERKPAEILRSCNEKRRDRELDPNWTGGGRKGRERERERKIYVWTGKDASRRKGAMAVYPSCSRKRIVADVLEDMAQRQGNSQIHFIKSKPPYWTHPRTTDTYFEFFCN